MAGCIAFPKLIKPGLSVEKFCVDLIEKKGFDLLKFIGFSSFSSSVLMHQIFLYPRVLLLPSTMYDFGDSHFRLGFGRSNMSEGLAKLEEYLLEIQQI